LQNLRQRRRRRPPPRPVQHDLPRELLQTVLHPGFGRRNAQSAGKSVSAAPGEAAVRLLQRVRPGGDTRPALRALQAPQEVQVHSAGAAQVVRPRAEVRAAGVEDGRGHDLQEVVPADGGRQAGPDPPGEQPVRGGGQDVGQHRPQHVVPAPQGAAPVSHLSVRAQAARGGAHAGHHHAEARLCAQALLQARRDPPPGQPLLQRLSFER
jgi:hypothetical protein